MNREAKIYLGYAMLGALLTVYLLDKLLVLVQRAPAPIDLVIIAFAALIIFTLSCFYALLAFVFSTRLIDQVKTEDKFIVLYPHKGTPIPVNGIVRTLRHFGRQFRSDESKPAFVLFIANGQLWVRPAGDAQHGV